ncbi:ubiquitin-related domain-containing protein [Pisolithus orientalis]|uniref:ubiquitin-related domain-containing protein n=1 Tax=Pisolithus orientalis TaxID=936130 RepID=UPI0022256270|nr:ubiquitin-related domain-containing protein [Pisolithus orientalis]KAI6008836.1 ubiquitin-related domain-containing protein [Pisolithus orientalis]
MAEDIPPTQSQAQSEVKPEGDNSPINVKVVSSTGDEVFFKIKRNTKLSKLQGAYANKVGKDVASIRFLYDGSRINEDDTPASLDMEDNGESVISFEFWDSEMTPIITDTIDVMVEQVGGSRLHVYQYRRCQ